MPSQTPWKTVYYATAALLAVIIIATVVIFPFDEILFDPVTGVSIIGLLTPLFVISLFLERTQEVFLTSWRKIGRDKLQAEKAKTSQQLEAAKARKASNAASAVDGTKDVQSEISDLESELVKQNAEIERYKGETCRTAFLFGISAGILIAIAGVRVLHPLVDADFELDGIQGALFDGLDIVITGGLLGGGSDGIHKAVSVITDFLDETRKKVKSDA